MSRKIDEVGNRYGRLLVLREAERSKGGNARWNCLCDCGNEVITRGDRLRRGTTVSCGCYVIEKVTTHGKSGTKIHRTYYNIKQRCNNKNNPDYHRYGGRGIKILFESFEEFYEWALKNGYQNNLSIDRINNDGNYSPDNCRWTTAAEQSKNRRDNVNITHPETGETMCALDWGKRLGGSSRTLVHNRINRGWTPQEAITTPVGAQR